MAPEADHPVMLLSRQLEHLCPYGALRRYQRLRVVAEVVRQPDGSMAVRLLVEDLRLTLAPTPTGWRPVPEGAVRQREMRWL